jgi:hypothetical protein
LAKDSTKQLFYKNYNWLGVFFNGLMKAIIRNGMIDKVSFFDSLSSYRYFCFPQFPDDLLRGKTLSAQLPNLPLIHHSNLSSAIIHGGKPQIAGVSDNLNGYDHAFLYHTPLPGTLLLLGSGLLGLLAIGRRKLLPNK